MPKRQDIKSVMIISSGPIVIGQGCEFDYSGTQACKALREEGIRIVLLNSNPATIMTDPEMADRIYIEPITPEAIDKILQLERERGTPVDALLPTLGGQTGLNCAVTAADKGILDKHKVQLIGANQQAIHKAEDRTEFKKAMIKIGLDVPQSGIAHSWAESQEVLKEVGLPVAIRPAYTLGGTGGGFAYTMEEFEKIAKRGLEYSLNNEILIEESCLGWKEYELEVMRDRADNVVIICSIENFDPMGVHTGDSITVAPAQTLTDKEYQLMRDAAIRIIREIGVETGGSNIQFAVHPDTGRMIVIEMNPRVSRSSALASKATGYPIARIAAKLALGYTLDELPNDITKKTPASFEPTIDYCVVKIPRWTFEKFPEADETLTTQMKSVGEAMSIGRTFKEALQKGIRSMEIKRFGLGLDSNDKWLKSVRGGTGTMSVSSRGTAFQAVEHGDPQEDHGQDARATDAHAADASGTVFHAVGHGDSREDHGQDARATDAHAAGASDTAFQAVDREGIEDGDDAFVPFNPHELSIRYSAYLPHWEQEGATYAVTFRLADSLPRKVLERWQHEREEIVRGAEASQRDLSATEQQRLSKLHSDRVEKYLDAGHGSCHLKDERAAEIVRDAMLHFDGQRYDLIAWCVMPNHVHVVVRPRPGYELAKVISSWKSYTSNQVNEVLGRSGALWQPDAFDHLIREAEDLERSVQYVLDNPRAAGLGAWPWVGCGKSALGMSSRGTAFQAVEPEGEEEDHGQDARATDARATDARATDARATDARATDARAMSSGIPTRAVPPIVGTRASEAPADTKEESAKSYPIPLDVLNDKLGRPCQGRLYYIRYAFKMGWTVEQVFELSRIDPWFLENIKELVEFEDRLIETSRRHEADLPHLFETASRELALLRRRREERESAPDGSDDVGQQALNVFLNELEAITGEYPLESASRRELRDLIEQAKQWGYSDVQLANVFGVPRSHMRDYCTAYGCAPLYKLVDTCAAEFEAYTPYYYSSVESLHSHLKDSPSVDPEGKWTSELRSLPAFDDEIRVSDKQKVIVLGGGPNRIGQGIEFDYCCVHAVFTARDQGYETVMVNSNPETVSTDYDTSDLLFFEPLTHEDVLNICERLNGQPFVDGSSGGLLKGVVVQFGGQTPLNLAEGLKAAGVPILGTSPESIDMAEDRDAFQKIINELGLRQPANGIAYDLAGAKKIAAELGYPVLVRPSYVLGGRAMEKCHLESDLVRYMANALQATDRAASVEKKHPILIDQFLSEAIEVDVDCISDGKRTVVCGVMEHIEEAGIHSGDSACALPPYSLSPAIVDEIKRQSALLAERLHVCGLMNVQYAVKDDIVYVIEVNPRASRTVPFVSKATGVPWAKLATKVMLGQSLDEVMEEQGIEDAPWPKHISVKEAVFPFTKFPGIDCVLGPEMRSTGEVMGVDKSFALAYAKSQMAAGVALPTSGTVLISVNDHDKPLIVPIAAEFEKMGFRIVSTLRTREVLVEAGIKTDLVSKIQDPAGPYLIDMINDGQIDLLINTPIYWGSAAVESRIRSAAVMHNLPLITTMPAARAAVQAIAALREGAWDVRAIQDYHAG